MNDLTLYQVILSFFIGGGFVLFSLWVAERFGSNLGGVIAGLPTSAAISILFIGISSGVDTAVVSAGVVPMLMGFSGIFLVSYGYFSKNFSSEKALVCSIVIWLALSSLSFLFTPLPLYISLGIFLVLLLSSGFAVLKLLELPVRSVSNESVGSSSIYQKGLLSGTIIGGSVLAAKLGGPVFGAIFAAFPAIYFSTIWVTSRSHGIQFSRSLLMPMLFSGLINVTVYVLAVRYFYPGSGMFWGTIASFGIALLSAAFVFTFVQYMTAKRSVDRMLR